MNSRGSVALMTLCLLAALGIGLAGYLAVAKQAMTLSNRSYQGTVSRQLAEMGLERALWSINRNDWSNWTLSGTTATRTISFAASKYGAIGTTGTIKLRVDNYNAFVQDATWSSSTSYSIGDVVGYGGTWYACVKANTNSAPNGLANMNYWVEEGVNWKWNNMVGYRAEEMVCYNGTWYRCNTAHVATTTTPDANGKWTVVPWINEDSTSGVSWNQDALVNWYNTWYRFDYGTSGYWDNSVAIFWRWRSGFSYKLEDTVCYNKVWYRCINATNSVAPSNSSYWQPISTAWTWSSSTLYNLGDATYRNGTWYRCLRAHSNQQPPNSTYWSTNPGQPLTWVADKTYTANSVVSYQGVWYRNTSGSNTTATPATTSTKWTSATTTTWSATASYSSGNHVSYGNVWYKCISTPAAKESPNDNSKWTALSAPVIYAEGNAAIANGDTIKTQLRAVVTKAPLFPNAAAAQTLTFGTGATVDSYDASTTTYASGSATYEAVLAGSNTSGTAVTISNATVKGYLSAPSSGSSPYSPLVAYSNSASLKNSNGSVTYPAGSAANVDLARISRSSHIPQFDIQNPPNGTTVSSTALTLGTPGATTPYFYSDYSSVRLNDPSRVIIVNGPVIFAVTSNFRIDSSSASKLIITPTGSLKLIVGADFRVDSTGGGIENQTLDPKKCVILLSDAGTGTFNYSHTGKPFYGVIYLSNSTSTFNVGNSVEMHGAIYAKNLTFGTNVKLHYDTSLRTAVITGVDAPCVISDWRELTLISERASL